MNGDTRRKLALHKPQNDGAEVPQRSGLIHFPCGNFDSGTLDRLIKVAEVEGHQVVRILKSTYREAYKIFLIVPTNLDREGYCLVVCMLCD